MTEVVPQEARSVQQRPSTIVPPSIIDENNINDIATNSRRTTVALTPKAINAYRHQIKKLDDIASITQHPQQQGKEWGDLASSVASVEFNMMIFFKELIMHLFQPFATPILYYYEGKYSVLNHFFWGNNAIVFIGYALWCMTFAVNLLYVFGNTSSISFVEVLACNALMDIRLVAIACKYAYLPDRAHRIRRARLLTRDELLRGLLLTGWEIPSLGGIGEELSGAMIRTGWNLNDMCFEFNDDGLVSLYEALNYENRVACGLGELDKKGKVSATLLLTEFILDSVETSVPMIGKFPVYKSLAMFFGVVHSILPFFTRHVNNDQWYGDNLIDTMILMLIFITAIMQFPTDVRFLTVGLIDYQRRLFVMHQLSAILSSAYRGIQIKHMRGLPTLEIYKHGYRNLYYWQATRAVAKDFGAHFFKRIQLFLSFFLLVVIISGIYCAGHVLFADSIDLIGTVLVAYDVFVAFGFIISMISVAKHLNLLSSEHRNVLTRLQKKIQTEISIHIQRHTEMVSSSPENSPRVTISSNDDDNDIGHFRTVLRQLTMNHQKMYDNEDSSDFWKTRLVQLHKTRNMLEGILQLLESQDGMSPIRVVGLRADDTVTRLLLGLMIAVFSITIRKIYT